MKQRYQWLFMWTVLALVTMGFVSHFRRVAYRQAVARAEAHRATNTHPAVPQSPTGSAAVSDKSLGVAAPGTNQESVAAIGAVTDESAVEVAASVVAPALPIYQGPALPVPDVETYLERLDAAHQTAFADFRRKFPGLDPTDSERFAEAISLERARYGFELTVESAELYDAWLRRTEAMQTALVKARGQFLGIPIGGVDAVGRGYALVGFDGAEPRYTRTMNVNAAKSTNANRIRLTGTFDPVVGVSVCGSNLYVNVNDHGEIYQHTEFQAPNGGGSRIMVVETPWYADGNRSHMTHVAGTVTAWGYTESLIGMSPRAWIRALIQQSSSHVSTYGMQYPGHLLTNSNPVTGQRQMRSVMGTTSLGSTTTNRGVYSWTTRSFDQTLWDYPYYIHFYAAGNDGGAYATLSADHAICKNALTMGSVSDVTRDTNGLYTGGGNVSGWSSRGPTYDGRIKPDLTANGEGLTSTDNTNSTSSKQGTSMATPNASGSTVLLIDYFNRRFPGHFLRASTVKALLINGADDRGNAGPDYYYGWGIVNVLRSGQLLRRYADAPASRVVVEDVLPNGQVWSASYVYPGTGVVRVALAWIDPPGVAQATGDRTPRLINNLDLRVVGPTGAVFRPFVMPFTTGNATYPAFSDSLFGTLATNGVNHTDNGEVVAFSNAPAGTYTLAIEHQGTLAGNAQKFSLAIAGLTHAEAVSTPAILSHPSVGDASDFYLFNLHGTGLLLGADLILRKDGHPAVTGYAAQVVSTQLAARVDSAAMAKGYWHVVARNPDGIEAVATNGFLLPAPGGGNPLPPVFTSTPGGVATVGQAFAYAIATADADTPGTSLSLSGAQVPGWLSLTAAGDGTGTLSGTPGGADTGTFEIGLTVSDGTYTTHQYFTLQSLPAAGNTPPVIGTASNLPDANIGANYATEVVATDSDGHAITWTAQALPDWLAFIDQGGGTGRITGMAMATGVYVFAATAGDGMDTTQKLFAVRVRPRGTVGLTTATFNLNEPAGSVVITVSRLTNDTGGVTVNYRTVSGTATSGVDFTQTTGTLAWVAGELGDKTFAVPVLDDLKTEGSETFTVHLTGLNGLADFGRTNATVAILDNETNKPPTVTLLRPAIPFAGVASTNVGMALHVAVADEGLPLDPGVTTWSWAQIEGPPAVIADTNALDTTVRFTAPGLHRFRLTATDGEFASNGVVRVRVGTNLTIAAGTGLLREKYDGITGSAVTNLTTAPAYPDSPGSQSNIVGLFEAPASDGDNYGQRLHGYFVAPQTGGYRFFIASDDSSELWLSADTSTRNTQRVASVSGNTGVREWTKYASQSNAVPIVLTAGQAYYILALHKEGTGGDNLAVRAVFPDGTDHAPLETAYLSPFQGESPANNGPEPALPARVTQAVNFAFALQGAVSDDGIPGTPVSNLVTQLSGPAMLTFADAADPSGTASGAVLGVYAYRLRSDDGQVATFADAIVELSVDTDTDGNPDVNDEDDDGDNMPDTWESDHGLDPMTGDWAADPDEDGYSNWREYLAGTHPRAADSVLRLEGAGADANPAGARILRWNAMTGRVYAVHATTNLLETFAPLAEGLMHPQSAYTDNVHAAGMTVYYMIKVRLAP